MSTLTVAMIVKNEEQFIEKVICNVKPITDEIVITDTGSRDKTIEIIKRFKIRLLHYKWNGDEAAARNFTISKCRTDWILFIDADEFIDINDYSKIRKLISSKNGYIAYRIICRQYFDNRVGLQNLFQQHWEGTYSINSIIRIFKNKENIFFSRPIYVSVKDSLRNRIDKVGNSNVVFHHLDILRKRQKKIEKMKWYCHDVFENFRKYPGNPDVIYSLAHYYDLRSEFDKAIKYYKKALELKPEYIKAKLSLGLSYVMLGSEDKGIRIIKACERENNVFPWEIDAYLNSAYKIIADRAFKERYE